MTSEFSEDRGDDDRNRNMQYSPHDIYDILSEDVIGQDEALKTISLIYWNTIHGHRSTDMLIGPTGSGKTEIFRSLEKLDEDRVIVLDSSQLNPEGWSTGSLHLSDVFRSHPEIEYMPVIMILDEFDKKVKPAVGSHDTDYNALLQDDFLKLCDGDDLEFKSENGHSFRVSCEHVTVLFAGAFTDIRDRKARTTQSQKTIGFKNSSVMQKPGQKHPSVPSDEITTEDLIHYGLSRELAGRIGRIIKMNNPTLKSMTEIARLTISKMEAEFKCQIRISDNQITKLAENALDSGLGARYIRTQLIAHIDRERFDNPRKRIITVGRPRKNATSKTNKSSCKESSTEE